MLGKGSQGKVFVTVIVAFGLDNSDLMNLDGAIFLPLKNAIASIHIMMIAVRSADAAYSISLTSSKYM